MRMTARQYANSLVDFLKKNPANEESAASFLAVLRKNRQDRLLGRILMIADELWKKENGIVSVTAYVAKTLDAAALTKLTTDLEKSLKKKISLQQKENPALGGGIALKVGDLYFDATVAGQLQRLRVTFDK